MNEKITVAYLSRKAVLYVRQSTARQVIENETSIEFQLSLKNKLMAYGWPEERIDVITSDLGQSGKHAENRDGYQKLLSDVVLGNVGAVASWDASRLSRNNADWAKLIDVCSFTNTLIIDEDGVYDPTIPTERMILGVKGTISDMEWFSIKKRMQSGLITKAKNGQLKIKLPIGYVYNSLGRIVFDPNQEIQQTVHKLFDTFSIQGSVNRTVVYFNEHNLMFPVYYRTGFNKGELYWSKLTTERARVILTHPIYCGRYIYGRSKTVNTPFGHSIKSVDENEWLVDIHNNHEGYITEKEFERNQAVIAQNGIQWRKKPSDSTIPGQGNALLQGIVYCGRCGSKMNVAYQISKSGNQREAFPLYICDRNSLITPPHKRCMQINGYAIDRTISELIKERLNEEAVRNAVEIKDEVIRRWNDNETLLKLDVQRCTYEKNLAKKRYMLCDPDNALVRIELEKDYNETIKREDDAKRRLEAEELKHAKEKEEVVQERLSDLVANFDAVWNNPEVEAITKKRLIRHLIQNVTLVRNDNSNICQVKIVFSGGETEEFECICVFLGPGSPSQKQLVYTYLKENGTAYTPAELADKMNELGYFRPAGGTWNSHYVAAFMRDYKIRTMKQHYIDLGYITINEAAEALHITYQSMLKRINNGWYKGHTIWVNEHSILLSPDILPRG